MGNIFDSDFRDFIKSLNDNEVDYLLVGGYAVILHGYRRTTGDLDIWVNRTKENYKKLSDAFYEFGLPLLDMTEDNFLNSKTMDVYSYGRPPVAIDILIEVKGCSFNEALLQSKIYIEEELSIKFINLNTLRQAKNATGRFKDLDDLEKLSEL